MAAQALSPATTTTGGRSDLDLMQSLSIGSYRFSIAWPRVLPKGRGRVNQPGLDFYDRLVDALLARGISPVATLYHWDLPQSLQDMGGWENRDSADWFTDYATVVFAALGDRVDHWLTINEAKIIAQQGYLYGRMAPGKTDPRAAGTVIHHLNLAHGRAVAAFRTSRATGRIGPCLQLAPCYPADGGPEAAAAARAADTTENALYLDPILQGRYPGLGEQDVAMTAGLEAAVRSQDLREIAAPVDFLGVNYYSPVVVDGSGRQVQPHPVSAAGWQQIYPEGLAHVLGRLHQHYGSPEVVITENGVPDDISDADDPAADQARVTFLRSTSRRFIGPSPMAPGSRASMPGRCLTTSSGPPATPRDGASSAWTSTPRSADRRRRHPGTPLLPAATGYRLNRAESTMDQSIRVR